MKAFKLDGELTYFCKSLEEFIEYAVGYYELDESELEIEELDIYDVLSEMIDYCDIDYHYVVKGEFVQ